MLQWLLVFEQECPILERKGGREGGREGRRMLLITNSPQNRLVHKLIDCLVTVSMTHSSLLAASMNDMKVLIGTTESGSSLRNSFKQPVTILMSAHCGSLRLMVWSRRSEGQCTHEYSVMYKVRPYTHVMWGQSCDVVM